MGSAGFFGDLARKRMPQPQGQQQQQQRTPPFNADYGQLFQQHAPQYNGQFSGSGPGGGYGGYLTKTGHPVNKYGLQGDALPEHLQSSGDKYAHLTQDPFTKGPGNPYF